jgi:DNA helicase HerA-like ATPase
MSHRPTKSKRKLQKLEKRQAAKDGTAHTVESKTPIDGTNATSDTLASGNPDASEVTKSEDDLTPQQAVAATAGADQPLGYITFDSRDGGNTSVMLIDYALIDRFRRGRYVRVLNFRDKRIYLGRVVEGPYYKPDYVGIDSSIARVAIQKAGSISMLPDYHAYASIEILGLIDEKNNLLGLSTRPYPKSPVVSVVGKDLIDLLNIDGNLAIGRLDGYDDIHVKLDSNAKKVLPRNVGIFGTVGSGKTNTSQVLIEEVTKAGWAVVVLDVEGEYAEMDKACSEQSMIHRLKKLGKTAIGLKDFHVVHPTCAEPDDKGTSKPFSIKFGGLSPAVVAELVGMNDAQQERFFHLYDSSLREAMFGKVNQVIKSKAVKIKKVKPGKKSVVVEDRESADSAASGADTAAADFARAIDDELAMLELLDESKEASGITLRKLYEKLSIWLYNKSDDSGQDLEFRSSWSKVKNQLRGIQRLNLFDTGAPSLDVEALLKPGRVTVINLSDSVDPRVNNLVIAEVLRLIFSYKRTHQEPKTLIVIEEAHTFISKENISRMEATMDKLREIARRGRKRWLGLVFISQQPSHLPPELYELCNTLFVHETNGAKNVDALRSTAGTVNEGIWKDVPVLGQGRCVIVSPQYKHPVIVQVDPCTSKRKLTD